MNKKTSLLLIILIALALRVWGANFGLPYYQHNDENEIVEPLISSTFRLKELVIEKNIWVLKPQSYIYGTTINFTMFPAFAVASEISKAFNISLDKASYYLLARVVTAIISTFLLLALFKSSKTLFENKKIAFISLLLIAANWKFIVFSHFVNSDIFLAVFAAFFYFFALEYIRKPKISNVIGIGVFFGLAIGTKITGLIALPAAAYIFYAKKDWRGGLVFVLSAFLSFIISNPFAIIDAEGYSNRIILMVTREGGLVLSSANNSIFRYLSSVSYLVTPVIFFLALLSYKVHFSKKRGMSIFLGLNVLLYLIFFTFSSERRTDRWMLPIIPIILLYGAYGINKVLEFKNKRLGMVLITFAGALYVYFPLVLLLQFKQDIPKYKTFSWAKENISENENTLVISETGYSPFNERKNTNVYTVNVYESLGALEQKLPLIHDYNYVIIASKSLDIYKNKYVQENFPEYYKKWSALEGKLNNSNYFEVVQKYDLIGPNIVTFSEMTIYKNKNLFCFQDYK